jgi:dihydroanticapsin dehydrogenase
MPRLKDKVAVVTGGGEGIGKATCLRLFEEGAAVVVAEINDETGRATADEITGAGGHALFVHTDVSDEVSVRQMVTEAVRAFDRIDILVNNAAIFVLRGIDATVEEWQQILGVNVVGPALVAKHVVNAVCPGTVWTQIVERLTREAGLDRAAADADPKWGGAHMIRRIAEPREIANAIVFLASDEASFITAECLMVDGGYVAK